MRAATRSNDCESFRQQAVAVRRIVSECAAREGPPQIEILQFHPRGVLVVAGEEREVQVAPRCERIQQRADAGHDSLARSWLLELGLEISQVKVRKPGELCRRNAVRRGCVGEDPAVGASRHWNATERVSNAEQILEGARHGAPSSAAREHKRAVDVEENESGHSRNRSYAAIPTVAFIRSSGCFAANVRRPRSLGRRLFLEAHALAFVQLIEAALHRAPMKKPLLSAIVANEPETPVTNESLDRAARHPSLLWAHVAPPRLLISIFVPRRPAGNSADFVG